MLPARPRELAVAAGLALGPAVGLGLARFAYALLLPSMRGDLHWSFAIAGAMTSANAAGYLIGAVLADRVTRRWGARRGYLACTGLTAPALLATAATGNTLALAGLRAAAGVLGAVSFIAGAALAARAGSGGPPRRAAALLSIYTAGVGAGIVIPGLAVPWLLAAAPPATGWRLGWVLLAALAAVAFVLVLPAARACSDPDVAPAADRRWPVSRLAPLLVCYALFGAGYIAYMTFIVAYLKARGATPGLITAFWVVLGAAAIASAFAWVPVIARLRAGRAPSVVMAVVGAGALLPLIGRSPAAALGSAVLFGGSFLALVAAVMSVARRSLPAHHWTSAIAVLTATFAAGQCLGPILTGVLSDSPAGLELGLFLSAGVLAAGSAAALAQRHHEAGLAPRPAAAASAAAGAAGPAQPRNAAQRPA